MFKRVDFLYIGIIIILIFGSGVSLGLNYDFLRKEFLERETKSLELQIKDFIVSNELIKNVSSENCHPFQSYLNDIAKQSEDLGESLLSFESKGFSQAKDYDILRSSYFLQEVQYWMNTEKYRVCNPNIATILFFYSNNDDSKKQGYVLTKLREEKLGTVYIFNFDVDEKNINTVKLLKSIYNITTSPSLVLNSGKLVEGFVDLDSLKENIKLK